MPTNSNGTNGVQQRSTAPFTGAPMMSDEERTAQQALAQQCMDYEWANNPRWKGVERPYKADEVLRLRGSIHIEHTLARLGAERLWGLLQSESYVNALGAVTGNQAVQQVQAGLKAIYVSGWQVAADANNAGQMYPDQSLYPADSVPNLCRRINSALQRADQVHHAEGKVAPGQTWFAPLVADESVTVAVATTPLAIVESVAPMAMHVTEPLAELHVSVLLALLSAVPGVTTTEASVGTNANVHCKPAGAPPLELKVRFSATEPPSTAEPDERPREVV